MNKLFLRKNYVIYYIYIYVLILLHIIFYLLLSCRLNECRNVNN